MYRDRKNKIVKVKYWAGHPVGMRLEVRAVGVYRFAELTDRQFARFTDCNGWHGYKVNVDIEYDHKTLFGVVDMEKKTLAWVEKEGVL